MSNSRYIRDPRGNHIGTFEESSDRINVRDTRGTLLGYFDKRKNETRSSRGDLVSRGYDATMQILTEARQ